MPGTVRFLVPLILLGALGACHTDPFSMKPEVPGVKIPEKAAPVETEAQEEETAPAPEADQ
ncbi:MAG: hypothetical protein FP825_18845 [Hyphomonas sp.]|uniref:hypothetical protein n=1 Tax=Hyphomonas sp. TaxID=87 RepID=UPI001846D291|nr:hypothetical protein [Hyphomonas sp.]MBU3920370.1 hypothetical protein [Alphaproteobacteria bacterium]MBA3070522.1 hypothetical protein [Hyphomonas sp.]MBU4062052.1 hypothetical protein [Alphaproteobacteria bacterium]MBU4164988.1 hypothetical protein [Alphaproteobacteria bacterium]MBU4568808.1 hypothetical protein [Alphaproteobacteria bacterium]